MSPGQRMGPVRDSLGYTYFELIEKGNAPSTADTAFASRLDRARKELLRQKAKRAVTLFLAQAAQQRGYEVYHDRLKKLEVSAVPMMTFRILGFGGRMFAVPFVDPQIEWLNVPPPSEPIVF